MPKNGKYRITAWGAEGGDSNEKPLTFPGKGAKVSGVFELKGGEVLKILVGQKGVDADSTGLSRAGGGGGGTFVVRDSMIPLLVAAGGNGCNWKAWNTNGPDGLATMGEEEGYGGVGDRGGGGGGFKTDAVRGYRYSGGKSFANGGKGGERDVNGGRGGFGGGGGAMYEGGGGGGYCGGSVVLENEYNSSFPYYGAKSWNVGKDQNNLSGVNKGDGRVKVERLFC